LDEILHDSLRFDSNVASGTRVAFSRLVARLLAAWVVLLGGCLITDPNQIGDPTNVPAALRSPPEAEADHVALDQIITQVYDPEGELEIPIIVRDENINDRLFAQVWIDFRAGEEEGEFTGTPLYNVPPEVPKSGVPDRDFIVRIDHDTFTSDVRCHRVEIRVTRAFKSIIPLRDPVDPADLGAAVFWVAMKGTPTDDVGMNTCP
jgi:hypothetical protein